MSLWTQYCLYICFHHLPLLLLKQNIAAFILFCLNVFDKTGFSNGPILESTEHMLHAVHVHDSNDTFTLSCIQLLRSLAGAAVNKRNNTVNIRRLSPS